MGLQSSPSLILSLTLFQMLLYFLHNFHCFNNSKFFVGYLDENKITPFSIILPKTKKKKVIQLFNHSIEK